MTDAHRPPGARPPGGRRALVTAIATGLALVGVLVGIQLADDGDGANRHRPDPGRADEVDARPAPTTGATTSTSGPAR